MDAYTAFKVVERFWRRLERYWRVESAEFCTLIRIFGHIFGHFIIAQIITNNNIVCINQWKRSNMDELDKGWIYTNGYVNR